MSEEAKTYDTSAAASQAGLNASVIRAWESRYGWPRPKRHPNGYRVFSQFEVDQLKKVAALVKKGTMVSELVRDGVLCLPPDPHPPVRRNDQMARAVPAPSTEIGKDARSRVEEYCSRMDVASLRRELAEAVHLRPSDRNNAVYVPVTAFLIETEMNNVNPSGRDLLVEELRAAIGHEAMSAARAVVCAFLPVVAAKGER